MSAFMIKRNPYKDFDPYSTGRWEAFAEGMRYGYYLRWFEGEVPEEYLQDAIENIRVTAAVVGENDKRHVECLLEHLIERLVEVQQTTPAAIAAE